MPRHFKDLSSAGSSWARGAGWPALLLTDCCCGLTRGSGAGFAIWMLGEGEGCWAVAWETTCVAKTRLTTSAAGRRNKDTVSSRNDRGGYRKGRPYFQKAGLSAVTISLRFLNLCPQISFVQFQTEDN